MKIAACQFAVTGAISRNMEIMRKYIRKAAAQNVRLIVFPECALTGYPPLDIPSPAAIDFGRLEKAHLELQSLSDTTGVHILAGTITQHGVSCHNSAILFSPMEKPVLYHKRALWGWDRENFVPGSETGLLRVDNLRIGVRICYEVRFPEYFRELYQEKSDLNIVLFHDTAASENQERYELLKAHLRTRAAENVTPLLCVNTTYPHQTAPTALFDRSGAVLGELDSGREGMLVRDYLPASPDFSESGRLFVSNELLSKP